MDRKPNARRAKHQPLGRPAPPPGRRPETATLARALSKRGFCSRSQGRELILQGRVRLDGLVCTDPDRWLDLARARIEIDAHAVAPAQKLYLMLNKPRGLVTSRSDEQGRNTVYQCFAEAGLPWLAPVGRLDKASEGLLLFTNDHLWAEQILAPASHVPKTYDVQVNCLADASLLARLVQGARSGEGELLAASVARLLRTGVRNSWIRVVLDEGKNRHIRRLLQSFGVEVLRLVRVAIGPLTLGSLAKGGYRHLTPSEVSAVAMIAQL